MSLSDETILKIEEKCENIRKSIILNSVYLKLICKTVEPVTEQIVKLTAKNISINSIANDLKLSENIIKNHLKILWDILQSMIDFDNSSMSDEGLIIASSFARTNSFKSIIPKDQLQNIQNRAFVYLFQLWLDRSTANWTS